MYTIGQVSERFGLPISTLRYYDKLGLFPHMARTSGIRRFGERELETLRVINCLKRSGLEIKEIKQFVDWCAAGPSTFAERKTLLERRRQAVEAEIGQLEKALDMLRFKCWFYAQAIAEGDDARVRAQIPDHMPEDIRAAYAHAHED